MEAIDKIYKVERGITKVPIVYRRDKENTVELRDYLIIGMHITHGLHAYEGS